MKAKEAYEGREQDLGRNPTGFGRPLCFAVTQLLLFCCAAMWVLDGGRLARIVLWGGVLFALTVVAVMGRCRGNPPAVWKRWYVQWGLTPVVGLVWALGV